MTNEERKELKKNNLFERSELLEKRACLKRKKSTVYGWFDTVADNLRFNIRPTRPLKLPEGAGYTAEDVRNLIADIIETEDRIQSIEEDLKGMGVNF